MVGKENKDSPKRIDLVAAAITALARINSLREKTLIDRLVEHGYGL